MKCETSCGAVVYTIINKEPHYVLAESLGGAWGFPKGHIEPGETEEQTALREIFEEVHLRPTLLPGFRETDEYSLPGKPGVIKRVIFFCAEYAGQEIRPQPEELTSAALVPCEEAMRLLTFASSRRVLRAADEFIRGLRARPEERSEPVKLDPRTMIWTREPSTHAVTADRVEITTDPHTDLWQRTYYHFRNDSAPVLQLTTEEKYFSFVVKTAFESGHRFDQCGVALYLDSENWLKASIEYENERFQHLGSVVTNMGYSDWATTEIDASVKTMWYRLSRRESDYRLECSEDGETFRQMRICHLWHGDGAIRFGVYACSPEDSSFKATFTDMALLPCQWQPHDGQAPDA